jgi:O-antigen/teichoic acid export membrane protein
MERVKIENISLKSRVVNAVLWLGITKLLGQILSWFITIYVARILSPDDYGLMGMSFVFIGFIALFQEFGLGSAIIQKKSLTREDLSNAFWLLILLNVFLYALAVLLAPVAAVFFHEPRLTSIIRIISLNILIGSLGLISSNMLARDMSFRKKSQAEFIGNLIGGISMLLFALKGFEVWSLVYGSITGIAVTNLLLCIYYPWKPMFSFSFLKIREMISFGLKVVALRLLGYTYMNSDSLIVGKLLGKTALGYYSLAFQFASIPIDKIVSLLIQVAYPTFSEIQNDTELLRRYFLKTIKLIAFVTFPLFVGFFLVADDAVHILLTEKWSPVILPLQILCIVSTIRAVNAMNVPLVMAKGRPGLGVVNNLIFVVIMPVAFYIGSRYGLKGFSYAWLIAFPIIFLLTTSISVGTIRLSLFDYLKELNHVILASIFMMAIVLVFQHGFSIAYDSRLIRFAGSVVTGGLSYGVYYYIFNREIFAEARAVLKR